MELNQPYHLSNETNRQVSITNARKVGFVLKDLTTFPSLIRFSIDPRFNDQKVPFNSQNWAFWIKRVISMRNSKEFDLEKVHNVIVQHMMPQIKDDCPPGQCAQLVMGFGILGINDSSVVDWAHSKVERDLASYSPQEICMLFFGALRTFSKVKLKSLLQSLTRNFVRSLNRGKFLQGLQPKGISCLLKAHSKAVYRSFLSDQLLEEASKRFSEFNIRELIDLITGMNFSHYSSIALDLLRAIEDRLLLEGPLPINDSINALCHFSICRYVPKRLLGILEERVRAIPEKISMLHACSVLGLMQEFEPHFIELMADIDINKNDLHLDPQCFRKLIFIIAVFWQDATLHPIIKWTMGHLPQIYQSMNLEDKVYIIKPLMALGYFEKAHEISQEVNANKKLKKDQRQIKEAVQSWTHANLHPDLEVQGSGNVLGYKVDILITGFSELEFDQKPIAIVLVHHFSWACNDQDQMLGVEILRNKILAQTHCEVVFFDLRDGKRNVIKEVLSYLEAKEFNRMRR